MWRVTVLPCGDCLVGGGLGGLVGWGHKLVGTKGTNALFVAEKVAHFPLAPCKVPLSHVLKTWADEGQ